ncbi:hypothetical protein KR026_001653, partial [Drosophila bipectinata]
IHHCRLAVQFPVWTVDFDVIILVETWLNDKFSSSEFFEPNLYYVFRQDRDAFSTQCGRGGGGGVIIAIRRSL